MPYSPKVWGSRAPLTGCLGLRPSEPSGEIFWREMPRLLQAKTGKRLPPSCCAALEWFRDQKAQCPQRQCLESQPQRAQYLSKQLSFNSPTN